MKRAAILLATLVLALAGACGAPREPSRLEIRFAHAEAGPGLEPYVLIGASGPETLYLEPESVLGAADVDSAVVVGRDDHFAVDLVLTPEGARRLARVTGDNVGRRLGIVVEGVLVAAPVIRDRLTGGRAVVDGGFDAAEARRLARELSGP